MELNKARWAGAAVLSLVAGLLAPVVVAPVAQAAQTVSGVTCSVGYNGGDIAAAPGTTLTFSGDFAGCTKVTVKSAIIDDSTAVSVTVSGGQLNVQSDPSTVVVRSDNGQTITGLSVRLKSQAAARSTFAVSIDNTAHSAPPFFMSYWAVAVGTVPDPNPPTPEPVFPPSAPTEAKAEAGDRSATVTWAVPETQGSFPVSTYQVQTTPSARGCLVQAPVTSCSLSGLTNGRTYDVQVRALSGAGWGPWASAGSVTPSAKPSPEARIVIAGTRTSNERVVLVEGSTTDLAGRTVQSWLRLSGESEFARGATRVVGTDGTFEWQRRTGKRVQVYFTVGNVTSNTVSIAARR